MNMFKSTTPIGIRHLVLLHLTNQQASIRAAESTICTVTRADSMGTLAQGTCSIL